MRVLHSNKLWLAILAAYCFLRATGDFIQQKQTRSFLLTQSRKLQSEDIPSSAQLQLYKYLNWLTNDNYIRSVNQLGGSFNLSHNQFSFLSQQEILSIYFNLNVKQQQIPSLIIVQSPQPSFFTIQTPTKSNSNKQQISTSKSTTVSVPQSNSGLDIDWRSKFVTPIKNQGACGACYAFAAIADVESLYLQTYGINLDLSEQQIIDCSRNYGNQGCVGGMMANAYRYIADYPISLEVNYPFVSVNQSCREAVSPTFKLSGNGYFLNDCNALLNIIESHPVSVILAVDMNFVFYKSGILNTCGSTINHAIQLVGIVQDKKQNPTTGYYIGKNSWGTTWGQNGFFYLDSVQDSGNTCQICSFPQYPLT